MILFPGKCPNRAEFWDIASVQTISLLDGVGITPTALELGLEPILHEMVKNAQ